MKYVVEAEVAWLASLTPVARAGFFATLCHGLTIGMRVLCHGGGDATGSLEQVRLLNEGHHRVSGYLSHYYAGNEDPTWVKAVAECVLVSNNNEASQQAEQAWSYAKSAALSKSAT